MPVNDYGKGSSDKYGIISERPERRSKEEGILIGFIIRIAKCKPQIYILGSSSPIFAECGNPTGFLMVSLTEALSFKHSSDNLLGIIRLSS